MALIASGGLLPLVLAGRVTYSVVYATLGAPHHDLSDIGLALIALCAAAIVGLTAGIVGSLVACFPALALIGKSGVFNRILIRRKRAEPDRENSWPF